MVKSDRVIGIVIAIVIIFVFSVCQSCSKNYLEITDEDYKVSNVPPNWSVLNKNEIAKIQEIEEGNLGYDPNRIKANVLFCAGLDRGNGNSYPNVVIEVVPLGNFQKLTEVINHNESIYEEHFTGYERVYLNYSQDNTMAILIYQYYGNNDTLLMILDGWALNKSVVWRVGFTSLAKEFEQDASTFSNILNSFVIKDGNITFGEINIE